jgi:hypothetical protein
MPKYVYQIQQYNKDARYWEPVWPQTGIFCTSKLECIAICEQFASQNIFEEYRILRTNAVRSCVIGPIIKNVPKPATVILHKTTTAGY